MNPIPAASSPIEAASPLDLLEALLDISLTGVILFRPVYATDGTGIVDLAYERLNPAAQRMLQLPQRPAATFLTLYPNAVQTGIFAFYQDTLLSNQAARYEVNYSYDGLDNYFQLAARRSGELLVVSFSDTADQDRSAVEVALRQSQARERQARAEAEAERRRLLDILMQLPAQVAINRGPDHVFELVNPPYQQLFPTRPVQGLPVREALPELEGQQFFDLLDRVYQTGEPFYGQGMPARVDFTNSGHMELRYVDVFFQALRNAQGSVEGILNFSYDVTGQVLARRQVEQLNGELETRVEERTRQLEVGRQQMQRLNGEIQAANEELQAANEEILATNEELAQANEELRRTNVDLDTFVYTASHDLKSPVVSLDALLGLLSKRLAGKLTAQEEQMLAMIRASSQRLQHTIRDLTHIAQVQRDVQEEKTLVDLPELFSEVRAGLAEPLEASGARLVVDFGVESLAYSRKNLRSILYNLLSNALKYRSPERVPEIAIRTRAQAGRMVLTISDNGLGLSEKQRQGMFAMFKRFHTHVEGSGVGLYTIKRVIENYGGQITVESELGRGTTFQVAF